MDGIELTVYGFDNWENRDALYVKERKVFVDSKEGTAHKKLNDYVNTIETTFYMGWDGEVYPQLKTKKITLN